LLVRQDIPGGFGSVARDIQMRADEELMNDLDRQREQISESRDSCSFALGVVDAGDRHFVPPLW
jgi:hypothetical protein